MQPRLQRKAKELSHTRSTPSGFHRQKREHGRKPEKNWGQIPEDRDQTAFASHEHFAPSIRTSLGEIREKTIDKYISSYIIYAR